MKNFKIISIIVLTLLLTAGTAHAYKYITVVNLTGQTVKEVYLSNGNSKDNAKKLNYSWISDRHCDKFTYYGVVQNPYEFSIVFSNGKHATWKNFNLPRENKFAVVVYRPAGNSSHYKIKMINFE